MKKKIFNACFLCATLSMLIAITLLTVVMYHQNNRAILDGIGHQATLSSIGVERMGLSYFEGLDHSGFRLTWVAKDGSVIFDTDADAATMENHGDREEIYEASLFGYGEGERLSGTLLEKQLYGAMRLSDQSVLRVAYTQATWLAFLSGQVGTLLFVVMLTLLLAFFVAGKVTTAIIEPINRLDLDHPIANEGAYEEIAPLLAKMERQHLKIKGQLREMSSKQAEFELITSEMEEALLLLDEKGIILTLNHSATRLFETNRKDSIGAHILTLIRVIDVQNLVKEGLSGTRGEAILPIGGKQYQLGVSPIVRDESVAGVVILLVDISERLQGERIRREFTANVSHELKTPLHSISGCAELLANGMVAPQDVTSFGTQIYDEAQRLVRLVDEIISLSQLDEGAQNLSVEKVNLFEIAQEVVTSLGELANSCDVSLELTGGRGMVEGNPPLLRSMVKNLCENGVRYHRPSGKVTVDVAQEEGSVILTVTDNGIGIAEDQQDLIFQRFYRVDKSRSKEHGGTGLGLSIVKHALSLHKGEISLSSQLGLGTTIRVVLPSVSE
ncbi:MAG: ATP-binding protein [Eubacteriales bacterium]